MKPTLANLKRTAARYSIAVETTGGTHNRAIYLDAPDGFQFEPELHCLVTEQGDDDTWAKTIEGALADLAWHGPRISKCPHDCPCKEIA
jgi:hypothetical protein